MDESPIMVLGVRFDRMTMANVLSRFEQAIQNHERLFCVTPNPEMCLLACRNKPFSEVLKTADLSIPDGFGILWAARYLAGKPSFLRWFVTLASPWRSSCRGPLRTRVSGVDVVSTFLKKYPHQKIFLLGASKTVNDGLTAELKRRGVNVVGNFSGNDSEKLAPLIVSMINASGAEVLFVAFGAPKQEQWIDRHLPALKTIRVAMGVGGAFDFLSGAKIRAPRFLQRLGLEWLFRLLIEPRRIRRIFNATVVFPWRVYISQKS